MNTYMANGGQARIPTCENIHVPLVSCRPLPRPTPPLGEPVLRRELAEKGFVPSEWSQQFLPGVTPEMLDWFWANMEKCYYLWAPGCHKSFEWLKSPAEYGFVNSVHRVSESHGPGLVPMGGRGITLRRIDMGYFPFTTHLEHVIIEGIFNDKGEIFNFGVHMWEGVPGGSVHITRGVTNTKISEMPKFIIEFSKPEETAGEMEKPAGIMPHPEYEAAQWAVFLPKLYDVWHKHPDPSQNVFCDLRVREKAGGGIEYVSENGPVFPNRT